MTLLSPDFCSPTYQPARTAEQTVCYEMQGPLRCLPPPASYVPTASACFQLYRRSALSPPFEIFDFDLLIIILPLPLPSSSRYGSPLLRVHCAPLLSVLSHVRNTANMGNNKLSIGVALPSHSPAKRLLRHGSRSTSPSSDSEHQAKRIKVTSMISMAARAMSNESRRHVYALSNGVARSINETQALVQQDSIDASSLFSLQLFSEVDKIDGKLGQYSGIEGGQVKENLADVFSAHKIIDVDDEEKEYAFEEFPNINKEDASESAPHLSKNWSDEEHQLLLTFFKAGKPWKKITEKIPGRTKRSCKQEWYNKFTKRNPSLLKVYSFYPSNEAC